MRTLMYVILLSLIFLGWGQVKTIAKAAGWKTDLSFLLPTHDEENMDEKKAKVIDDFLKTKNSPMFGTGKIFLMNAKKYNLPVYLMVAMAGAESNFGTSGYAIDTFNAVGLGVHEGRTYQSWEAGIADMAWVLRNYYFDEGLDNPIKIQNKWAPRGIDNNGWENSWADNVNFFINELEKNEQEISC